MGVEEKLAPGIVAGINGRFHSDQAELAHCVKVADERGLVGHSGSNNHEFMSEVNWGLAKRDWEPLGGGLEHMKSFGFKETYPLYKGWTFGCIVIGEKAAARDGADAVVELCREAQAQESVMLSAQAVPEQPATLKLHIGDGNVVETNAVYAKGQFHVQPLGSRAVFGGGLGWHSESIATLFLQWMLHADGRQATGRMKSSNWYNKDSHVADGIWPLPAIGRMMGLPQGEAWKGILEDWPSDCLDVIRPLCVDLIVVDAWDPALKDATQGWRYRWAHEILRGEKKRVLYVVSDDPSSTKPPLMLGDFRHGVMRVVCPPEYEGSKHVKGSKAWLEESENYWIGVTHNPVYDNNHTDGDPLEFPDGYVYESKPMKKRKVALHLKKGDSKKKGLHPVDEEE